MKNNKSNKVIKNFLFLFLVIFAIIGICFFNYKIDPYNLFGEKEYFTLQNCPRDLVYTAIKKYKGPKLDTVLIGGSEAATMFDSNFYKDFDTLCLDAINYEQYIELLDYYLKMNPKLKNVIVIICYSNIIHDGYSPLQDLEKNDKLSEFKSLYFSFKTTKDSLDVIIQNIVKLIEKKKEFVYEYKPKYLDSFDLNKEEIDILEKENFERFNNLIKFLNNKNLNYTIIIPPYNISYLSLIYEKKFYQDKIDNFRRFLVSVVPEDKKIYDFAFVNKYTLSDAYVNKDILYFNDSHPSIIWGVKIYRILYNKENKDEDLYFLLNKENVESVIKKGNLLLNEYIKNNRKKFEFFKELSDNQNEKTIKERKKIRKDEITEEAINEIKYLERLYNKK